jgi:peptide/nickel transport system permease protein
MKRGLLILWFTLLVVMALHQPHNPLAVAPDRQFAAPSLTHLLGTDRLGRDLYSRNGYALRRTLVQVGAAEAIGFTLAVVAAACLVFLEHRLRIAAASARMFILALRTLPPFLVALSLAVFLRGPGAGMIAALAALSFLYSQPVYESELRHALRHPSIEGAVTLGCSRLRILITHLAPLVAPRFMRYAILDFASLVAFAALFSFIGLTNPPEPSIGEMLHEARPYILDHPWMFLGPTATLIIVLLGLWFWNPKVRYARSSQ